MYMALAVVYLIQRFFYRIWQFLSHWYVGGYFVIGGKFLNILEYLDQTIALRITLKYFWQPLYRDYSFIGYMIGIPARAARTLAGFVAYGAVLAVGIATYLAWATIPLYLVFSIM